MKRMVAWLLAAALFILPLPAMAAEAGCNPQISPIADPAANGQSYIDKEKAREALKAFLPWLTGAGQLSASLEDSMGDGIKTWVFQDPSRPQFPNRASGPPSTPGAGNCYPSTIIHPAPSIKGTM